MKEDYDRDFEITSGLDIETEGILPKCSSVGIDWSKIKMGWDRPTQDLVDSYREMIAEHQDQVRWNLDNRKTLTDEEQEMEWFINAKNSIANDEECTEERLKMREMVFNITKKTIGFDLSSFYKSDLNAYAAPASMQQPVDFADSLTLKNSLGSVLVTDPSQMFVLPTICDN